MQVENTPSLKPTRSSFIRSLPESMPVDEVIERGREIGLSIQPSDVHSARYYMRQAAATSATSAIGKRLWLRAEAAATAAEATTSMAPPKALVSLEERAKLPPGRRPAQARKTRATPERTPEEIAAMTQQLRVLVLRLGSDRTRAVIAELEDLAATLARSSKRARKSR